MGFWDDIKKELENDPNYQRNRADLRKSLDEFKADRQRSSDMERAWRRERDSIISDPHELDGKSENELDRLRITAQEEIERLTGGISDFNRQTKDLTDILPPKHAGMGGLFGLLGGATTNLVRDEIHKNKRLLAMVEARQKALKTTSTALSPAATKILEIKTLREERDELKKVSDPSDWPDIDREYAALIDKVRSRP